MFSITVAEYSEGVMGDHWQPGSLFSFISSQWLAIIMCIINTEIFFTTTEKNIEKLKIMEQFDWLVILGGGGRE